MAQPTGSTPVGIPISSANLLQHMAVPSKPALYQIGCLERRVTLYSQQVRALNLAYALLHQKKLAAGSRVIIVGGGAAGVTAAIALAQQDVAVTLIERLDTLLPFQSGNLTRWLHPHIYEWPEEGCRNPNAGLPLLNWSAGYASDVATTLRDEFYLQARKAKKLKVDTGVRNVKLHSGQGAQRLEWNEASGRFRSEPFDALILAIGFGLESSSLGAVQSYWRNDDLAQSELDADRKRHYLISGCGDGGLVDLLRIRIRDFRHDKMLEEFVGPPRRSVALEASLLLVEESACQRASRGEDPSDFLYDEYQRLRPNYVDEQVAGRLRQDTQATLNGSGRFPWNLNSSILNRFLASALIGLDQKEAVGADWWRGTLAYIAQEGAEYSVRLDDGESRKFGRVILRHGPKSAISQWISRDGLAPLQFRNELDQTRVRSWPENYFGPESPRQAQSRPPGRTIQILIPTKGDELKKLEVDLDNDGIPSFEELANVVYACIDKPVSAFTYGKTWRLRNMVSGHDLKHARESAEKNVFGQYFSDPRPLEQVGILPGDILETIILDE